MTKACIILPFEYALAYKMKRKLISYGVEFEERKIWCNYKLTIEYLFDEDYVAVIQMNECLQDKELSQWEIQYV